VRPPFLNLGRAYGVTSSVLATIVSSRGHRVSFLTRVFALDGI